MRGYWGKMALLTAAVAAWQIYDIATATEAPRQALAILNYIGLGCALIGLVGSLVMVAKNMSEK